MGYYRFTQWTSREWAIKIARNSNFPVWIARLGNDGGGDFYAVLRASSGTGERFKRVYNVEEFGVEQAVQESARLIR